MTQDDFHAMFEYVGTTGQLIHRYTVKGGKIKGSVAGSPHNQGYIQICIRRKKYLLHRIIWFYHYGYWPGQLDHIDGDRSNNRLENLRECSYSQNHGNKRLNRNNTSGAKGVTLNKATRKWRAQLAHRYVGEYATFAEAVAAYDAAARIHYGEFALTNQDMIK